MNHAVSEGPDVIAAWRAATSDRERAEVEDRIWETKPNGTREKGGIGTISRLVGCQPYEVMIRHQLHLAGSAAIWARVADGMPMRTATEIYKSAKNGQKSARPSGHAIAQALRAYDAARGTRIEVGGKVWFRRKSTRLDGTQTKPIGSWGVVRAALAKHLESRLAPIDLTIRAALEQRFESDLKVLFSDWTARIQKAAARTTDSTADDLGITRPRILNACLILGIDAPKAGKRPELKQANRRRKAIARQCHPDVCGGGNDMTDERYRSAMAAYELLESYDESFSTKETHSNDAE